MAGGDHRSLRREDDLVAVAHYVVMNPVRAGLVRHYAAAHGLWQLDERIAHLTRAVEELSDVVTRQDAELRRLSRRVGLLMEREADREAAEGTIPLADQRPPHW